MTSDCFKQRQPYLTCAHAQGCYHSRKLFLVSCPQQTLDTSHTQERSRL
jgi:hypothetical protein